MDKITVKELPVGIKIKATKKRLLSIPKLMYQKVKMFYHNSKEKIKNYVTEEDKNIELNKKIDNLKNKKGELYTARRKMLKQEEFVSGDKKYLLEAIDEEIEKYVDKTVKLKNKGLGVFSIGKLYVSKYISNQKEKANKRKAKRELEKAVKEQLKIEQQEQELREKLEKLGGEKVALIQKQEEAIKANPQLEEYSKKINAEEKTTSVEKKIIPITSVRKATEEEKAEIKKSSKFKKAIAAISAIAIAAGVAIGAMNAGTTNTIDNQPITYAQENIQEEVEKSEKITLNDYVNLENGSKIFDSPTFDGKSGVIGTNGYDGNTLFKVNAVSYIDESNSITSFNLVGREEEARKSIQNSQIEFIKNNPNAVVHSIHVTPCNSTGEPELDNELGGWTNTTNSQINKANLNNINQQNLGGMVK